MRRFLFALGICCSSMAFSAPTVEFKTNQGTIQVELDSARAPKTVANLLQYVKEGHYNGTLFHRVIDGFMIQGGGFDAQFREKPTRAPIANEAANGLKNEPGTLAMARTQDPHSATAQFFINVAGNDFLNHRAPNVQGYGYAVFGRVTKGMDIVNRIAKVKTGQKGMHADVPVNPVVIEQAQILKSE